MNRTPPKYSCVLLFLLLSVTSLFAQLSKKHYIPLLSAAEFGNANPNDQYFYISTPSKKPIRYLIKEIGKPSSSAISGIVSNNGPVVIPIGSGYGQLFQPSNESSTVVNDRWLVPGATSQFFKSVDIQIFNRFGKQLFKLTIDNSEFGWDGTYQGIQMPSSDYWFSARLVNLNDEIIQESGNFSLIRL